MSERKERDTITVTTSDVGGVPHGPRKSDALGEFLGPPVAVGEIPTAKAAGVAGVTELLEPPRDDLDLWASVTTEDLKDKPLEGWYRRTVYRVWACCGSFGWEIPWPDLHEVGIYAQPPDDTRHEYVYLYSRNGQKTRGEADTCTPPGDGEKYGLPKRQGLPALPGNFVGHWNIDELPQVGGKPDWGGIALVVKSIFDNKDAGRMATARERLRLSGEAFVPKPVAERRKDPTPVPGERRHFGVLACCGERNKDVPWPEWHAEGVYAHPPDDTRREFVLLHSADNVSRHLRDETWHCKIGEVRVEDYPDEFGHTDWWAVMTAAKVVQLMQDRKRINNGADRADSETGI